MSMTTRVPNGWSWMFTANTVSGRPVGEVMIALYIWCKAEVCAWG